MSEPTPLSAEAQYPIEIIQGVEGFCIGLNNYRIAGPKPWGGGTVVKRWHIGVADLRKAIPELLATIEAQATEIARQARELELAEHNLIGRGALLLEAQTEIAALKGALKDAADHMMWMLGGWDDRHDDALPRAHEGIGKALVLAGKEAQGD